VSLNDVNVIYTAMYCQYNGQ